MAMESVKACGRRRGERERGRGGGGERDRRRRRERGRRRRRSDRGGRFTLARVRGRRLAGRRGAMGTRCGRRTAARDAAPKTSRARTSARTSARTTNDEDPPRPVTPPNETEREARLARRARELAKTKQQLDTTAWALVFAIVAITIKRLVVQRVIGALQ